MLKMYYRLPNGKSFAHVSRSCTGTLCLLSLQTFYPDIYNHDLPQKYLKEHWDRKLPENCLVMVRDPIERLRSYQARKQHSWDCVYQIIKAQKKTGVIDRDCSENMSMRRYHHLAPLTNIAEHDSHFVLYPNVKEACEYLGLNYSKKVHFRQTRVNTTNITIPDEIIDLLQDDIGVYRSLSI